MTVKMEGRMASLQNLGLIIFKEKIPVIFIEKGFFLKYFKIKVPSFVRALRPEGAKNISLGFQASGLCFKTKIA